MIEFASAEVKEMSSSERTTYDEQVPHRVIRFGETRPQWAAYREALLPAYQRALFGYIGTSATENPGFADAHLAGENFGVTIILAEPGRGAALHAHTTEEMFLPLSGRWCVYWGEEGQHRTFLEQWDAISLPAPVMRGFWNAGDAPAHLLAVLGGGSPPPPVYAASVLAELEQGPDWTVNNGHPS